MTAIEYEEEFHEDLSSGESIMLVSLRPFLQSKSFHELIEIIEHMIFSLKNALKNPELKAHLYKPKEKEQEYKTRVKWLIKEVEDSIKCTKIDIGVRFDSKEGIFYPTGNKELDEKLVKEPLRDLDALGHEKVSTVWKRGLRALLKSQSDQDMLKHVIIDVHEALEAFARIVCKKPKKRLGQIGDSFIKALNLNLSYNKILKEYIDYANKFRHPEDDRPDYDYAEVEAFVYLTGLFIRLGIEKIREKG